MSAVEKNPKCYEHIDPNAVGNHRHVVVSDQSGRSNILAMFRNIGIEIDPEDPSTWGKVGRNKTCPCGSGKKFKHCHGSNK